MKCPVCGNELNEGAKFCVECGTPVAELTAQAPAVEATAQAVSEPEATLEPVPEAAPAPEPENAPAAAEPAAPAEEEPESAPAPEPAPASEPVVLAAPAPEPAPAPAAPASATIEKIATDPRMLLTTAQYFFLTILFHIPVVGLVFLFVWGCGKPKNVSLKRFSLAMLIMRLLGYFLMLACTVVVLLGLSDVIPGFSFSFMPHGWYIHP